MLEPVPIEYSSTADWISAIATVVAVLVAIAALWQWKAQKHYEIKLEALSFARTAYGYIQHLRHPVGSSAEIKGELLENYDKDKQSTKIPEAILNYYYLFQSRRLGNRERLMAVLKIREKLWAAFGEDNLLTKYYNLIIDKDRELAIAHDRRYFHFLYSGDSTSDTTGTEILKDDELKEIRQIIYYWPSHDAFDKEILDALKRAETLRKKRFRLNLRLTQR